ncbi:hypothetical protein EDD15DRAFT_2359233 [Pisolithus albus]|nr:hypothetical protein EDD15DRAFT_2359233 [Pisolithus albus]
MATDNCEGEESTTASPSVTPSTTLTCPLSRSREQLLASGLYLADDNIAQKVHWVQQGRSHYLAVLPDEPSSSAAQHELADLSAIAVIDSKNYWLTSDAGYQRGACMWPHLYDVKLSCTLSAPPMNPLKADFATLTKNLHILMQKIATPGFEKGNGFLFHDNGSPTPTRFKIRHCLFERLTDDNTEPVLDLSKLPNGADFLPENMELTHQQTRDELFLLQRTHRLQPLQARGQNGRILSPKDYRDNLENAVVELLFNLWHWPIGPKKGEKGNDCYTAEIVHIRVLQPPPPPATNSPRKRKIPAYLDPEASAVGTYEKPSSS